MKFILIIISVFMFFELKAQIDTTGHSVIDGVVIKEHVPINTPIPYKIMSNPEVIWEKCDTIYSTNVDKEPTFKNNGTDVIQFFNENILELIYDSNSDGFPPTSFKMTLIINNNDEVERIAEIRGNYSSERKNQILERLKKEQGWKSGEIKGQKVCSEYYFVIGCILWN